MLGFHSPAEPRPLRSLGFVRSVKLEQHWIKHPTSRSGFDLNPTAGVKRDLGIAIPTGASAALVDQLMQAAEYGKKMVVNVTFYVVRDFR